MPGLGTIINVVLLVAGGLLGLAGGRFITPRIQAHRLICARFAHRRGRQLGSRHREPWRMAQAQDWQ